MNRSKFYFLFSLFATVLVSGVLLFGFGTARGDIPDPGSCGWLGQNPSNTFSGKSSCPGSAPRNTIDWNIPNPSSGHFYDVTKVVDGVERLVCTGTATGTSGSCQDTTAQPGVSYTYYIYAAAGGSVACGPTGSVTVNTVSSCTPLSVVCSPKDLILNVGDVRTFTGSPSGGATPYTYQWSNVTCGEEWTCSSNNQISNSENQCKSSCSGSCSHTSGQTIQNCKLFFGAPGFPNPTITVRDSTGTSNKDSCPVTVVQPKKYSCSSNFQCVESASGTDLATCQSTCKPPSNGSILIKRVDVNLNPISGTRANVDGSVAGCADSKDSVCGGNPSLFDGYVTPGPHGTTATKISGFTQSVATCEYTIGQSECQLTSASDYASSCSPSGSDCWFNTTVNAGKVRKVVYRYTSTSPPPQCFINGQTNGRMDVKVGDHFSVPWSNSANLKTLVTPGWSGLITCWGSDVPDPSACKAKYLGGGGLPACPPESGTCVWANSNSGTYLYFQTPGTSAVSITATDQAGQQGQCKFSVTAVAAPPTTGDIDVNATLDGATWTGSVNYALNGPSSASATSVSNPTTFNNRNPGGYSVTYNSGGPAGKEFKGFNTTCGNNRGSNTSQTCNLAAGARLTYTMVFESPSGPTTGDIDVNATLDGATWTGSVNYALNGPSSASATSVSNPTTFNNRNPGGYSVTYNSGGPAGKEFKGFNTTCGNNRGSNTSQTCNLAAGARLTYTMVFESPSVTNQLPTGVHDANDNPSCTAQGWTTDPDDRNLDLTVKIYSDGSLVKTDTANRFRPDLQSAGVCPGGTCAFVTSLSGAISPGVSHSIEVKAVDAQTGQEQPLGGTPKPILCSQTAQNCDTSYSAGAFHACYFDGTNPPMGASPVLAQNNESSIDHNWGTGVVDGTGKPDQVSAIWRGRINFAAGRYIFHTRSDDGVMLNLEGFGDIVSNWTDHGLTQNDSLEINLPAGERNVTLKWYENGGGAAIKLWWDTTGLSINNASCGGISAPSTVTAGQSFSAQVAMNNTGTKTWTTDSTPHRLGSQNPQDNTRWGLGRVGLPFQINQGESVPFSFTATAPTTPGTYPFDWKMLEEGIEWFGQTCSKTIQIQPSGGSLAGFCQASPNPITQGGSTVWTAFVSGGIAPYTYSWSGSDGLTGSGMNIGWTYADTGTKQATVVVADSVGSAKPLTCASLVVNSGGGGCTNDCSPSGASQCIGSASYQTCGNFDADSCLEWGPTPPNQCPAGQQCVSNSCVALEAVPPNPPASFTAFAGPACNVVNFFWADTNNPPADSFTISCNSGAITLSGLTGNSYPFTGAEGNTTYDCAIAAIRSGLSSSARPLDTGSLQTPRCPDFGLNYFGELAVILSTAGTPKNTNAVTIEVNNAGTSFSEPVELSFMGLSGQVSGFTATPHFGAGGASTITLAPGQTTTFLLTVSGQKPPGTYNGFANVKGLAPSLGMEHTIAVPLKIEVKSPGFKEK